MTTEKTAYANLLRAAEHLLEQHERWMPREDDWNALREAVRQARMHPLGEDDGLVPLDCACPNCGQRCMEHLVWLNPGTVQCQVCRTSYEPHADKETVDDDHT